MIRFIRFVDSYGVMHYARGSDSIRKALCGSPPAGNSWGDPAPFLRRKDGTWRGNDLVVYDPAAADPWHVLVCPTCAGVGVR